MKKVRNKNKDYKSHLLLGAKLFCLLLCLKALSPCCCLALAVERAPRRHSAVVLCRMLRRKKALQLCWHSVCHRTWGQHGEMQHHWCCRILNTDVHGQLRRQGGEHCPHLKMKKQTNPLNKIFTCLPYLLLPISYQDAQLTLDDNGHHWWLTFINNYPCVAPDIWVGASYTHLQTAIDTSLSAKLLEILSNAESRLDWSETASVGTQHQCHRYGNGAAWKSLKTLSLSVQGRSY